MIVWIAVPVFQFLSRIDYLCDVLFRITPFDLEQFENSIGITQKN